MKSSILLAAVLCAAASAPAVAQQRSTMRFQDMDRNRDGVITREEWRGNDRSFRNHDWNQDGRLSGDEVRPGARRDARWDDRDIETSIEQDDDWTEGRFRSLDHNNDGRLSRAEWHGGYETFSRIDRNRDNVVTRSEFIGGDDDEDREDHFNDLDNNQDGRISRDEWHGSVAVFNALDANRDGALTRREAIGTGQQGPRDEFRSVDVNNDGAISRNEWHWNTGAFDRLDANRDNRLTRQEWDNSPATVLPQQSNAYRAGYERGRQEGVQAGREDKPRGWDLEGQRELEQADSGYQQSMGDRAQYQEGYRAGFRRGYREGFGR